MCFIQPGNMPKPSYIVYTWQVVNEGLLEIMLFSTLKGAGKQVGQSSPGMTMSGFG